MSPGRKATSAMHHKNIKIPHTCQNVWFRLKFVGGEAKLVQFYYQYLLEEKVAFQKMYNTFRTNKIISLNFDRLNDGFGPLVLGKLDGFHTAISISNMQS